MMQHFIFVDLVKAHIKAHFRKDPKTGKLIFIADYDSKVHGKPDAEFHKGHKVKIENPNSKHHGKEGVVTSYNPKYHEVGVKFDDGTGTGLHKPEHLSVHDGKAPAVALSVSLPVSLTLNDAKKELGLAGLSYSSTEMKHEQKRVESMTPDQLERRIGKIKSDQKLYNFMRAILEWGNSSKFPIAVKIQDALKEKAKLKLQAKTAQAQVPNPKTIVQKTTFDKGDKVRINNPRSKFDGKEGEVLSFNPKYGIRVKLNDGTIAEVKEAAAINLGTVDTTQTQTVNLPDPKNVKPPKPVPQKTAEDFPHDKKEAWKYSTEVQRSLAKTTGMVPLDKDAAEYIQKNLSLIIGSKSKTTNRNRQSRTGYSIPGWASSAYRNEYERKSAICHYINQTLEVGKPAPDKMDDDSPLGFLFAERDEWEKAGYNYDDIEPVLRSIMDDTATVQARKKEINAMDVVNTLFSVLKTKQAIKSSAFSNNFSDDEKKASQAFDLNMTVKDAVKEINNHKALFPYEFDEESFVGALYGAAGPYSTKSKDDVTLWDALHGFSTVHDLYAQARKNISGPSVDNDKKVLAAYAKWQLEHSPIHERAAKHGNVKPNPDTILKDMDDVWNITSYSHEDTKRDLRFMMNGDPKDYTRWGRTTLFPGYNANRDHDVAVSAAITKIMENKTLKDISGANIIAKNGSARSMANHSRKFKSQIFHKTLMDVQGPREVGTRIARMSGSVEDIHSRLAKKHIKEAEKLKKLKDKGADLNAPANEKVPPPSNLGCTFKSVDKATEEQIRKKIAKRWDKNVHGGFSFKIHGIYQIGGMDHYDKYKKVEKDRNHIMYGYHSTNFECATAIVKSSYRESRGGMLGAGVYVTDMSSKSAQYLKGNCQVCRHPGTRGVFLINKISLGKVYNKSVGANNKGKYSAPNEATADTVFAPKGKMVPGYSNAVLNDEHVVKDAKGVIPMYWVDMELTDRNGNTP